MKIGMVGLGRMGGNMTTRLLRAGHDVVGYARHTDAVQKVVAEGATGADSLEDLVSKLDPPRAVWVMVPAGDPTSQTIDGLTRLLDPGDIVIDGGNSRYTESIQRGAALGERGISFMDAGTSGGVWGLEEGYCLMIGADETPFRRLEPIFAALAPPHGYARVGPVGSGHFVKMVHNGIEYGLMQAYAEGFELLRSHDPALDTAEIAEVWRHGSVVRSWLLDLAARALSADPDLASVAPYVEDSGEGRWTIETAIDDAVPTPVMAAALFARFASRSQDSFGLKMLAALRREFGGHGVRPNE